MTYDVHIFAEVRVKIPSIEADSQTEAIMKAEELADLYQLFDKESPADTPPTRRGTKRSTGFW